MEQVPERLPLAEQVPPPLSKPPPKRLPERLP
jgi:hypothetical protein